MLLTIDIVLSETHVSIGVLAARGTRFWCIYLASSLCNVNQFDKVEDSDVQEPCLNYNPYVYLKLRQIVTRLAIRNPLYMDNSLLL